MQIDSGKKDEDGLNCSGGFAKETLLPTAAFWGWKRDHAHGLEYILDSAIGLAL